MASVNKNQSNSPEASTNQNQTIPPAASTHPHQCTSPEAVRNYGVGLLTAKMQSIRESNRANGCEGCEEQLKLEDSLNKTFKFLVEYAEYVDESIAKGKVEDKNLDFVASIVKDEIRILEEMCRIDDS